MNSLAGIGAGFLAAVLWFDLIFYVQSRGYFFFNDTATTEIYTLSLHDALPISQCHPRDPRQTLRQKPRVGVVLGEPLDIVRSEEHTSELQSLTKLVCRLLL